MLAPRWARVPGQVRPTESTLPGRELAAELPAERRAARASRVGLALWPRARAGGDGIPYQRAVARRALSPRFSHPGRDGHVQGSGDHRPPLRLRLPASAPAAGVLALDVHRASPRSPRLSAARVRLSVARRQRQAARVPGHARPGVRRGARGVGSLAIGRSLQPCSHRGRRRPRGVLGESRARSPTGSRPAPATRGSPAPSARASALGEGGLHSLQMDITLSKTHAPRRGSASASPAIASTPPWRTKGC